MHLSAGNGDGSNDAAGDEAEDQSVIPARIEWVGRNTTHEPGDPQYSLHVDTFSGAFKAWVFFEDTAMDNGPLHYVLGSHRNTEGRLRWLHHTSLPPAVEALREPSFRLQSTPAYGMRGKSEDDVTAENEDEAAVLQRMGFQPAKPVLPLPGVKRTLALVDTSGLHRRGRAAPGTVRRSMRLGGDTDGGVPRLNPFRAIGRGGGGKEEL